MTDEAKRPLRRRNQQCAGDRAGPGQTASRKRGSWLSRRLSECEGSDCRTARRSRAHAAAELFDGLAAMIYIP
jgi:hypothetical protein